MEDQFDDPLHHEWTLYHRATSRSLYKKADKLLYLGNWSQWIYVYVYQAASLNEYNIVQLNQQSLVNYISETVPQKSTFAS